MNRALEYEELGVNRDGCSSSNSFQDLEEMIMESIDNKLKMRAIQDHSLFEDHDYRYISQSYKSDSDQFYNGYEELYNPINKNIFMGLSIKSKDDGNIKIEKDYSSTMFKRKEIQDNDAIEIRLKNSKKIKNTEIKTHPFKFDPFASIQPQPFNKLVLLSGKNKTDDSDNRKHECSVCLKKFIRASILKIHFTSHTGEKSHHCPSKECEMKFAIKSNLVRHLKVCNARVNSSLENDEVFYTCPSQWCKRNFSQKTNLARHFVKCSAKLDSIEEEENKKKEFEN